MFSTTSLLIKSIIVIFSGVIKTRDDLYFGKAKLEYVFASKGFIFPRFRYNAVLKSYEKISSKSKISSIVAHLINLLEQKNFFVPKEKRRSMIININNLIYRMEPSDKELRILASILSTLSKK